MYNDGMTKQFMPRYDLLTVNPRRGGYSDIRLWPCYMVYSGSIFLLAPQIGVLVSLVVVSILALLIARNVSSKQPVSECDSYHWTKDLELALKQANPFPLPELEAYKVTAVKKVRPVKKPSGRFRSTSATKRFFLRPGTSLALAKTDY